MWLLYLREKDCFSLHAGWLVGASITWFHSWRQGSLWLSGNHGCTIAWRTWSSFTWRYTHMKPFLPMLALWLLSYTCTMYWYSFRDSLDWLFVICVVFLQFQPKKTSHQTIINCQRFNCCSLFQGTWRRLQHSSEMLANDNCGRGWRKLRKCTATVHKA